MESVSRQDRRPVIGVAPMLVRQPHPYLPSEQVASGMMDAVVAAGGLPMMLPVTTDKALIDSYVELCDGFVLPGGQDVNPALYGGKPPAEDEPPERKELCPLCDALEIPLVRAAYELDKPLLGICRGAQLMNVALGGTLVRDLGLVVRAPGMVHWQHHSILNHAAHPVDVRAGSLLHRVVQADQIQVNSNHRCSVQRLGKGLELSGVSTDGVPEAIEAPDRRFFLGVQWHPEYTWRRIGSDLLLWKGLVSAAATSQG